MKNHVPLVLVVLLLVSILSPKFSIKPVNAEREEAGTIYIRADGSVDPSSAPISNVGNVYYTFTANIEASIVVQRNNVVVDGAGHTLQGTGSGNGLSLLGINNVTIKRITIKNFSDGIYLYNSDGNSSDGNTLSSNIITNNGYGIYLHGIALVNDSDNNMLSSNIITNNDVGISLADVYNNTLSNNTITNNHYGFVQAGYRGSGQSHLSSNIITDNEYGILINSYYGGGNTLSSNIIKNNHHYGIWIGSSWGDILFNNTVANNTDGVILSGGKSDRITLSNNNITNNNYGIRLESSPYSSISANNIENNDYGIYSISSTDNNISANTITNSNIDGIYLSSDSNNNIISANTITNNTAYGILVSSSSGNSVIANSITNNQGNGVALSASSSNNVSANTITNNNQWGIYLIGSSGNSMSANNITNNNYDGIHILSSSNNSISANSITNNTYSGILLSSASCRSISANNIANNSEGIELYYGSCDSISANIIANNGDGIFLGKSSCPSISANSIANNHCGIYLAYTFSYTNISANSITNNINGITLYASSSSIFANNITNNEKGIYLISSGNLIYHNNFINNTIQAYFYSHEYSNSWDDGYPSGGNYWSDYVGVDLYKGPHQDVYGSDGIGDTPYIIDVNNRDNYPLIQPGEAPTPTIAPTIADFNWLFRFSSVKMIYPSDNAPKPLGCAAASVSDWLASMAVSTKLTNYTEGLDTNAGFVNQTSGKALGSSGTGIVTFGGPFVNPVVKYAETSTTPLVDRAPIRFYNGGSAFYFQLWNGTSIPGANLPLSVINKGEDMFVIEVYRDGDGRNVMLCYGMGWKGTYAAGKYFDNIIYPNLGSYDVSWTIVKWQDTNGDGFVNNPGDGDTYTVIASGTNIIP